MAWAVLDLNQWPLPCQGILECPSPSVWVELQASDRGEHSDYVALGLEAADCVGSHFWLPPPGGGEHTL
jgi:hypothetical protein